MNLRTRSWPWFCVAAALTLFSCCEAPNGVLAGVTALAALLSFLGACIHRLGRDVRDDPERLTPIVRELGIAGLIATEMGRDDAHRV